MSQYEEMASQNPKSDMPQHDLIMPRHAKWCRQGNCEDMPRHGDVYETCNFGK